jgi:hypothetical protein
MWQHLYCAWLPRDTGGCDAEDASRMISMDSYATALLYHSNKRSQKSKYVKDAGHTIIDQTDSDDIINAATNQGIYNLTLGLSDKERRTLVAGKAYKASTITFREAKEGYMEAHNFLSTALITSAHTRNEKKRDASSVATT